MNTGSRMAMVLAVGYLLGRRRKLRTAAVLAGAAASGKAGSLGGAAIKRGASLAGTSGVIGKMSPQLGGIADTVRGELIKAGKTAAIAVVNNRIESVTESLHQRTEAIRGIGTGSGDDEPDPAARDQQARDSGDEQEPEDEVEGSYDDEELDDDGEDDGEEGEDDGSDLEDSYEEEVPAEEEPEDSYDEPEDSYEEEDEAAEDEYDDDEEPKGSAEDEAGQDLNGSRRVRRGRRIPSRAGR